MEYLDIVDDKGIPTGKTVSREAAHRDGILHRTAHVWVVRYSDNGTDILLQKRSMEKESFPGLYDTSSAGHIPAGEEPLSSALRELKEELGINAGKEQLHYAGSFRIKYEKVFHEHLFRDNEVTKVYVYSEPVDINSLVLQESEVDEVRWFNLDDVWAEIQCRRDRFCVPAEGLKVLRNYLSSCVRTGNMGDPDTCDDEFDEELVKRVDNHNEEALQSGGVIIACGMARFDDDTCVASVFERADHKMYENKNRWKV